MHIENKYFKLTTSHIEGQKGHFAISLLPECDVYRGHFPGQPVSPGVMNIETVRECTMKLVGRPLTLTGIRQCRFMAVVSPTLSPRLQVNIEAEPVEGGYIVHATMSDEAKTYLELKAEMKS